MKAPPDDCHDAHARAQDVEIERYVLFCNLSAMASFRSLVLIKAGLGNSTNGSKRKTSAWKLQDILPKVLVAGDAAGVLTEEGAKLLDPTGQLQAGIPLCPPEGDAGTGMVATNSVAERTGNVSAGTSVFAMIVLEKELSKLLSQRSTW